MKKKRSWQAKLHQQRDLPKVVEIGEKMSTRWGRGTCAIPSPAEVDEAMKMVPCGKVTTINHIRHYIAGKHGATIGCPMTTGIFAWIAAHAAAEALEEGKTAITPFWRTLKNDGALNEKYPGGQESQKARLEAEGHQVIVKGKRWLVKDFILSIYGT